MTDTMTISVRVERQYGTMRAYPECDKSRLFCALKNRQSLTEDDIGIIKRLGYTVVAVPAAAVEL